MEQRESEMSALPMLCKLLDALHMRAIGAVWELVNLLFRMSLHPSKSK